MSGDTARVTRVPGAPRSGAGSTPSRTRRTSSDRYAPHPRDGARRVIRTATGGGAARRLVAATAIPLVLSSCGAVLDDPPVDPKGIGKPAQVNAPNGFAPLTGLPAESKDAAARPALAVAVRLGGRVTGVESADFVYHEAGSERIVALFQTKLPKRVGPVAEARPFDAKMLPVTGALVATTAGPEKFVRQLVKAKDAASVTPAKYRTGFRGGYAIPATLLRRPPKGTHTPVKLATYANPGQRLSARGGPARRLTVELPGEDEVWIYDAGAKLWRREGRPEFAAANVVVQLARFKRAEIKQTGLSVPTVRPYGKGNATVVSAGPQGGQQTVGTWRKSGTYQAVAYGTGRAKPMLFTPGPTWVIIAPIGTKIRPE